MSDIYYQCDGIVVRRTLISDVDKLKNRLRPSDIQEVLASHNYTSEAALMLSIQESTISLTIEYDNEAVAMFGINPDSALGNKATIWFLGSSAIDKKKIRFLRHGQAFIDLFLSLYPYLYNYIDARNKKSIAWLKFLGAKIQEAKPYGFEQLPFHYFSFERTI